MGVFWLIALALVLLAILIVILPLWRQRPAAAISQDAADAAIFRERLAELDTERQEGRLADEQYQQLRAELERTLLVDVPQHASQASPGSSLAVRLAPITALVIPLLALGYYYISSYQGEASEWIALQQRLAGAVTQALQQQNRLPEEASKDLQGFTRVLQARLLREGMSDPDGLYLLGNAYLQLRRLPEALGALGRAYELNSQWPDIMLAYAQAMILTQDERLSEAGVQLLHAFLQSNPDHQGALLLLGFGAFNSGAYEQAIQVWQRLLTLRQGDSQGAQLLKDSIARAEQLLADSNQGKNAPAEAVPGAGPQIAVTVDLAPALRERLSPQDTLFVFAKAADGPPMPLAAVRQPVQSFPVQVTLDDNQAVMPSMKLSNFQQVVVSARISKTSGVNAQPGDLQGSSVPLSLQDGVQSVSLVIDQVVQ